MNTTELDLVVASLAIGVLQIRSDGTVWQVLDDDYRPITPLQVDYPIGDRPHVCAYLAGRSVVVPVADVLEEQRQAA